VAGVQRDVSPAPVSSNPGPDHTSTDPTLARTPRFPTLARCGEKRPQPAQTPKPARPPAGAGRHGQRAGGPACGLRLDRRLFGALVLPTPEPCPTGVGRKANSCAEISRTGSCGRSTRAARLSCPGIAPMPPGLGALARCGAKPRMAGSGMAEKSCVAPFAAGTPLLRVIFGRLGWWPRAGLRGWLRGGVVTWCHCRAAGRGPRVGQGDRAGEASRA
jgi:hypothetical protein